ncbi:hypothetical protein ACLB2K_063469 [Fragaria x ananassa]
MVTSTKGGDEHEPQLPLQGSQSSTTSSQPTTASQELNPKKLAEEISKALDAPARGPARPRGSKTKEYLIYGDDSYTGPITRNMARRMMLEGSSTSTMPEEGIRL